MYEQLLKKVQMLKDRKQELEEVVNFICENDLEKMNIEKNNLESELHLLGCEMWDKFEPFNVDDIEKPYVDKYKQVLERLLSVECQIQNFKDKIQWDKNKTHFLNELNICKKNICQATHKLKQHKIETVNIILQNLID